ncbi:MAG TPA: hypothetical protein VGJ79_02855 [Candidatus Dormibacteraeota bacterium]
MSLLRRRELAVASILGVMLGGFSTACGSSPTQASLTSPTPTPTPAVVASPTPDAATLNYVALIKTYWIQIQAADEATSTTNVAALVCLGKVTRTAPNQVQFVDPQKCHARMVVSLIVHESFLAALRTTPAPPQFAADDHAFRTQLPKGISHLKALIALTAKGTKTAVLQAAETYVNDFLPMVTDALDDVDPSVVHN